MSILEHDFFVELIIEYVTCDILTIYNGIHNQENRQYSTYLALDEVMNFPLKTVYQQLKNLIQDDATEINEIVGTEDRVAISVYYQDLLDKVLRCNKEESFKEQYTDYITEYSIEIRRVVANIIQNFRNYEDTNELSER